MVILIPPRFINRTSFSRDKSCVQNAKRAHQKCSLLCHFCAQNSSATDRRHIVENAIYHHCARRCRAKCRARCLSEANLLIFTLQTKQHPHTYVYLTWCHFVWAKLLTWLTGRRVRGGGGRGETRDARRAGINRKVVTSSSHKTRVSWAILPMPGMRNRSPRVISRAPRPTWNCKELKISSIPAKPCIRLVCVCVCDDKARR